MPELPEVETVRAGLQARVLGRSIARVEVLNPLVVVGRPRTFIRMLDRRVIRRVDRKGKVLSLELASMNGTQRCCLLVRLGMTGQLTVASVDAPLEPHTHIRIGLKGGTEELRYRDVRRFGRLRLCTCEELTALYGTLGPDAREITKDQFLTALRGRKTPIKSWLLNQQLLSGVGNIYADESLFEARIHPLTQAGRLSPARARRLHQAVKKVLDEAVALQGTSFRDYINIEGRPGNFLPRLRVYQRTDERCQRCGQRIRRIVIAGRSSHFCPHCQR